MTQRDPINITGSKATINVTIQQLQQTTKLTRPQVQELIRLLHDNGLAKRLGYLVTGKRGRKPVLHQIPTTITIAVDKSLHTEV